MRNSLVIKKSVRQPVSRVLYALRRDSYSSGPDIAVRLNATYLWSRVETLRITGTEVPALLTWSCFRQGLPCRNRCRFRGELLPRLFNLTPWKRAVCFCGTFPRISPAGRYPVPCFLEARTFLFRGFSFPGSSYPAACCPTD